MNRHVFIVVAIVAAVGYGIWSLVSEPDYSISVVRRDAMSSDIDVNRRKVEVDSASAANWADLATSYLEEAKATGDQKMFELAKEAADRVLQIDSPHRKRALLVQAEVALRREQYPTAYLKSREAEALAKDDPDTMTTLVRSSMGMGKYEEAERLATKLFDSRASSQALRLRGLARFTVGKDEAAERDLIGAIGLEEKTDLLEAIDNRASLSEFYLRTGDLDRARRVLAAALKVSDQARLFGLLGEIELKEGNFDKARVAFDSAFQKDHDPQYLLAQAKVEKAKGREEEFKSFLGLAIAALKAEVSNSPAPRKILLARALIASGKPEERDLAKRLLNEEIAAGSERQDVLDLVESLK